VSISAKIGLSQIHLQSGIDGASKATRVLNSTAPRSNTHQETGLASREWMKDYVKSMCLAGCRPNLQQPVSHPTSTLPRITPRPSWMCAERSRLDDVKAIQLAPHTTLCSSSSHLSYRPLCTPRACCVKLQLRLVAVEPVQSPILLCNPVP
jgi:hypothetical protein